MIKKLAEFYPYGFHRSGCCCEICQQWQELSQLDFREVARDDEVRHLEAVDR